VRPTERLRTLTKSCEKLIFEAQTDHIFFSKDKIMDFGQWIAHYNKKIDENCKKCEKCECLIWYGYIYTQKNVSYGQINAKLFVEGRGMTFTKIGVHRLRYMLKEGNLNKKSLCSQMHVSHLCMNSLCTFPPHLSYEPAFVNIERKACVDDMQCSGHDGYQECILNCCRVNQTHRKITCSQLTFISACLLMVWDQSTR